MTKVAVIYGTRPEMIKLGPLLSLLGQRAVAINTGQHFDPALSDDIRSEISIPRALVNLEVGGQSRAAQVGGALVRLEEFLLGVDGVIVQGDTNSGLAGALAANALDIPLFHVEAGLRSFDRRMPEEHNRVLVDHLSDMCWAPTDGNVGNLTAEGIPPIRVLKTGNPIVEALAASTPSPKEVKTILSGFDLRPRNFILVTLHRPENVDDPTRLVRILDRLGHLPLPVIFPMHPRTMASIQLGDIKVPRGITTMHSIGYRSFLGLAGASSLVISDSGGVHEEVSILKVPLVVLRRSTERPEVLESFASLTDDPDEMVALARSAIEDADGTLSRLQDLPCPFGDGKASIRMYESLMGFLQ